jgi:predicted acyl esterase
MLWSRQSHDFCALTGVLVSVFLPFSVRVLIDVSVPMRDGVHLSADVHLPVSDDAEPRVARRRVVNDAAHPSHMVLPIIPPA